MGQQLVAAIEVYDVSLFVPVPAEVPGLQESEGSDTSAFTKNCLKTIGGQKCLGFRFSPEQEPAFERDCHEQLADVQA